MSVRNRPPSLLRVRRRRAAHRIWEFDSRLADRDTRRRLRRERHEGRGGRATITVNEHRTEATAATALGVMTGGPGPTLLNYTLRFDRPFLYIIRSADGEIMFMGRVMDPSK